MILVCALCNAAPRLLVYLDSFPVTTGLTVPVRYVPSSPARMCRMRLSTVSSQPSARSSTHVVMYNSMCDAVFLTPTVLIKIDDWGTMESSFRDLGTGYPKSVPKGLDDMNKVSKCAARSRRPDWATGRRHFFLSSIWSAPCRSAAHSIIVHHADLIRVPSLCSSAHSSVGGQ